MHTNLEKQPEWLKEVVPGTTVKRAYGVHRSADKIRDYLHNCLKKYMEEVVYTEKDEDGNITKEVLGVSKIFDPVLLEEIIQYNDQGNFDRIIAAELAIAQALTVITRGLKGERMEGREALEKYRLEARP